MGTQKDAGRWVGFQTKLVLLSTTANNPTTCRRPMPFLSPWLCQDGRLHIWQPIGYP